MKIREVLDKKVGNTTYNRYIIILPKNIVMESKLLGKELKAIITDENKICLEKK